MTVGARTANGTAAKPSKPTVAVLGANGFIGSRLVELLHLTGAAEIRPVVRRPASAATLSRFDLDLRVADAFDSIALQQAIGDCETVVHAVAGDIKSIARAAASCYRAAEAAGAKRLIYLSSAAVHGQNPDAGSDEDSRLSVHQPISYNNAKVRAERTLRRLRAKGGLELVILRPGIVFGPRSQWTLRVANEVLCGQVYLHAGGAATCNCIYIDNLVHAIQLACIRPDIDGHAFLLGESEHISWAAFYRPIAAALGRSLDDIAVGGAGPAPRKPLDRLERVLASAPSMSLLALLPNRFRRAARAALDDLAAGPDRSPWTLPDAAEPALPVPSLEMRLLQQCRYRLPDDKARKHLGYLPQTSYQEACRRTTGWLAFAGYPLVDSDEDALDSHHWQRHAAGGSEQSV